jgi:aspartate-semialdehyde dehydrogenase
MSETIVVFTMASMSGTGATRRGQQKLSKPADSVALSTKKANNLANNWVPERPDASQPSSRAEVHTPSELHV